MPKHIKKKLKGTATERFIKSRTGTKKGREQQKRNKKRRKNK